MVPASMLKGYFACSQNYCESRIIGAVTGRFASWIQSNEHMSFCSRNVAKFRAATLVLCGRFLLLALEAPKSHFLSACLSFPFFVKLSD